LFLAVSGLAFGQLDKDHIVRPPAHEKPTVAGLYRSEFYHEAPLDTWIWVNRALVLTDAVQTASILSGERHRFYESSNIYSGMGSGEAFVARCALGYAAERLVCSIPDRWWRQTIGWALTVFDFVPVENNLRIGVRVRF